MSLSNFSKLVQLLTDSKIELMGRVDQQVMDPIPTIRTEVTIASYKQAAVMCLLIDRDNIPCIVLIKRAAHPLDKHKGQIAFPGGKREDSDTSLEQTAMREVYEEIGIPAGKITVLSDLTEVVIPVSRFVMYSYLGVCKHSFEYKLDPSEVDRIIEFPVDRLLDDNTILHKNMNINGYQMESVPYFAYQGHEVWGATAMVLHQVKCILQRIGL